MKQMNKTLEDLLNNKYIVTLWEDERTIIRAVSSFYIECSLDKYVEQFINIKTFPYVNSLYNKLLNDGFDELPLDKQREIRFIIKKYVSELDSREFEIFKNKTKAELKEEYGFSETELNRSDIVSLFGSVKGGYYCEMLLFRILLSLGYDKIISKLYFQFGDVSPTGIDVPFINVKTKTLVLGECKIYKNIKSAIKSCYKDLDSIYNDDKLNREFVEWNTKYSCLNDVFRGFVEQNHIVHLDDLVNSMNKIVCLGFVVGNKIGLSDLTKILHDIPDFGLRNKFDVLLITIPIESKDMFIEKCFETLVKMETQLK